jgi:hypothetical protein
MTWQIITNVHSPLSVQHQDVPAYKCTVFQIWPDIKQCGLHTVHKHNKSANDWKHTTCIKFESQDALKGKPTCFVWHSSDTLRSQVEPRPVTLRICLCSILTSQTQIHLNWVQLGYYIRILTQRLLFYKDAQCQKLTRIFTL